MNSKHEQDKGIASVEFLKGLSYKPKVIKLNIGIQE